MENIELIYDDYSDLLEEFGREKIFERYTYFLQRYKNFINVLQIDDEVFINERTLSHAIMDYFSDVSRLKHFHKISKINDIKVVAYECFWLLKRKPLQIKAKDKENLVYINEKAVLSFLIAFMTGNNDDAKFEDEKVFDNYINSLFYFIKYRNYDPHVFEMILLSYKMGSYNQQTDKRTSKKV